MSKALIAMSGGVDSSVAAKKIKDLGYECIGCTMRLHNASVSGNDDPSACGAAKDIEDAAKVSEALGMKHLVFDFTSEFKEKVIDNFVSAYEKGYTPNPCIECNRYMKFEKLVEKAKELGCDTVVTGHYARIEKTENGYVLKKACDPSKDQSYVLYRLNQDLMSHILFPLGDFEKSEIRKIATENNLVNADKPDSQDICFVPDGDYASVVERFSGRPSPIGNFVGTDGHIFGKNKGIIHYTIGQRKGLGIAYTSPLFVTKICPDTGDVILGSNDDLMKKELTVTDMNWISGIVPSAPIRCSAKIRYRHAEQSATVTPLSDTEIKIEFDGPVRAITPGQSAVLYDGDIVLGGGIIKG